MALQSLRVTPDDRQRARKSQPLRVRAWAAGVKDLAQRWSLHRRGDSYSSYVLAERAAHVFVADHHFSEFGLRWHRDPDFVAYYRRYVLEQGRPENWHSADRKYFMRSLLKLVVPVAGDMAECGVYRGATARLMALGAGEGRTLHLFDSFEGLSAPEAQDGRYWQEHDLTTSSEPVREALADLPVAYELHAGWIPDRFHDVADRRFSFVHIDVDLYQPTLDALHFFYPRLEAGGLLLLDDYGFTTCPGATQAVDEWASTVSNPVIEVPTGQAFVLKR